MGKKRKEEWDLPERESWLSHDYTSHYRRGAGKELKAAHLELLEAARGSRDVRVVRTYERHLAAKQKWELFTARGKNDDEAF